MFSHVTLGTNDMPRARRFYDAVLGVLGDARLADHEDEALGYGPEGGASERLGIQPGDQVLHPLLLP